LHNNSGITLSRSSKFQLHHGSRKRSCQPRRRRYANLITRKGNRQRRLIKPMVWSYLLS
jgi:hypothetical protein